jgi:hypothetical protein
MSKQCSSILVRASGQNLTKSNALDVDLIKHQTFERQISCIAINAQGHIYIFLLIICFHIFLHREFVCGGIRKRKRCVLEKLS